jgi:hypothetical protein
MVLWNLLNAGPSHSGPLLVPYESMWVGTPGTKPCHDLTTSKRMNRYCESHTYGGKVALNIIYNDLAQVSVPIENRSQ